MITDELNQIWSFLQRYIDEQSVDMVQELRMQEVGLNQKMDRMDWLARNAEFMSPESIIKCLAAFKDLYNFDSTAERNLYVKAIHSSEAVFTVVNLINHTRMMEQDEETNSRVVILLSILEPLLVNDMNLERAMLPELRTVPMLIDILKLPQGLKRLAKEVEDVKQDDPRLRTPIFLKYALRCLTSCMRMGQAVEILVNSETGVRQIVDFMEYG